VVVEHLTVPPGVVTIPSPAVEGAVKIQSPEMMQRVASARAAARIPPVEALLRLDEFERPRSWSRSGRG
jgi:hypothetical protein